MLQEDLYVALTNAGTYFDASLVQVDDLTSGPAAAVTGPRRSDFKPATTSVPQFYIVGSDAAKRRSCRSSARSLQSKVSAKLPRWLVVDTLEQQKVYDSLLNEQRKFSKPTLGLIDLRK